MDSTAATQPWEVRDLSIWLAAGKQFDRTASGSDRGLDMIKGGIPASPTFAIRGMLIS